MARNAHQQFTFIRSFSQKLRFSLFLLALLAAVLLLPGATIHAQGAPAVSYNPAINTIFIGSNLSAGVTAGSQVISLQNLAAALSAAGANDVLISEVNNDKVIWLSRALGSDQERGADRTSPRKCDRQIGLYQNSGWWPSAP